MAAPYDIPDQLRRPRGRPKRGDAAALEQRLISVGSALFFRHGYGATSMSAVAVAARVSKPTLYSRFPSKSALLRGIVAAQVRNWGQGVDPPRWADCATLEQAMIEFGDMTLRISLSPDFVQTTRLMTSESGRFPELSDAAGIRFQTAVEALASIIAGYAESDGAPCRDPHAIADQFLAAIMGWSIKTILADREISAQERAEWVTQAVGNLIGGRAKW